MINSWIILHILFWIQACASQNLCYFSASTLIKKDSYICFACCCVRRWQGVSSRPGVEAVCEGSSFLYRPHNGPEQELHTRLPVSTRDRPTGGWADLKQLCTYTYSDGSHVVDGPYFQDGVCVRESDCRCDVNGEQHKPGDTVFTDCRNW